MYNRYIPNGASYDRISEEDAPAFHMPETHSRAPAPPTASIRQETPPDLPAAAEKKPGLSGLLKGLKLEELDTGDILLLLIVLFLFLEGDDMELIITLGLLLLLGL